MSELFDPPHDKENLPDIYFVSPFVHSLAVGTVGIALTALFSYVVEVTTIDKAPGQTRHEMVASASGQPAAHP